MKNYRKSVFSILLCLAITVSMCFGSIGVVFAADEVSGEKAAGDTASVTESLADEFEGTSLTSEASDAPATIPLEGLNKTLSGTTYTSGAANSSYKISVPKAGSVIIYHGGSYASAVKVNGNSPADWKKDDGGYISVFYIGSATTATVTFTDSYVNFRAFFAPKSRTIKATSSKKTYYMGRPDNSSSVSTFKIKVPKTGYLYLNMGDAINTYSLYYKTSGFKDYEYLSNSDATRYIGVKKGTYTIKVKSISPVIVANVKFVKKTQGSYGTKKSKAKALKKGKTRKGVIITNSKKTHWYKIRNPKLQKVSVVINNKISEGGYGALKVTFYDKRGSMGSKYIYSYTGKYTAQLYTLGKNNKLVRGTYWVKVQSYKGGNGFFSVKWK